MYIPVLNRHLAICGLAELPRLMDPEPPGFWRVVTVLDEGFPMPPLSRAGGHLRLVASDVRLPGDASVAGGPKPRLIPDFLAFADAAPERPLLVHCSQGVSRSTALALVLLLRAYGLEPTGIERAVADLLEIRPQASPNPNMLAHGLEHLGGAEALEKWTASILSLPIFRHNERFA